MTTGSSTEPRSIAAARARALRAARAVTLGLLLASAGCAASVSPLEDAAPGASSDASPAAPEASPATADVTQDAAPAAVGDVADAGRTCEGLSGIELGECCQEINWDWSRGCAAWGPLVPPAMDDHGEADAAPGARSEAA